MSGRGARIAAEGLGFAYSGSGAWTLANVSLAAAPGTELWITGANASGKSTLLALLAGVIPEVIEGTLAGTVSVTVAPTSDHSGTGGGGDRAAVCSMVMQDSGVYLFRTVYDEVSFVLQHRGIEAELIAPGVAEALAVLGIGQLSSRLMHTLSGGERQKVAVAAALAVEPDLLLLDEPFEQLDPASAAEVLHLARHRAETGTTLVIATRNAEQVPAGAAEVHLVAGRVASRGADSGGATADAIANAATAVATSRHAAPLRARSFAATGLPLLELERVTHRFSATAGITGVDLLVHAGESVALLGPNGAGKTTLMKHANGLLRPDTGLVRVAGADIAGRPVWETARDIGMLFQNPDDQIFNRTVLREVAWSLRARGASVPDAERAALEALEELGLASLAAENPHELTASQRQLIAFASLLVVDPRLYVLDEPTKALDAAAAEVLASAVDRRLAAGAGALLVTHDLDFAVRLADRSMVLVDGAIVSEGATAEVLADRPVLEMARLVG